MPVSLASRSLRMRFAARQCSTTDCGSVPKDWIRALRAPPSIRVCTARENASPRFGSNSENLAGVTSDLCHSLLALRSSATGPSRYAAEASACVAAVCPAAPVSGTCAPGLKSKTSLATAAPSPRCIRTAACSQLPCSAHLLSCAAQRIGGARHPSQDDRIPSAATQAADGTRGYEPLPAWSRTLSATCGGIGS